MERYKRFGRMVSIGLATSLLCGCTLTDPESGKAPYAAAVSMESTPIIDYTVPLMLPNILVDKQGYQAGSGKEAAVMGRRLPEVFLLIEEKTGETVYRGSVETVTYNEELGLYTGFADFSEFEIEGSYYLECDIIGRSCTFPIKKRLYRQLFDESAERILPRSGEQTADIGEVMELLIACEWYPQLFVDEDENQIPDMLEHIGRWLEFRERSGTETSEGALYAALLAKYSYIYQKYDHQYATECLKRASAVYEQTQNTLQKDAENFFALTELYRAAGLSTYRNQIKDYKTYFDNNSSYLEEKEYLYGSMTYLATRQAVDRELCGMFMKNIMDRGEEISNRYQEMIHPVNARNNGAEELLNQAAELSCANYVLNNYQYTSIIEKFLHYLMGGNRESVSFFSEEKDKSGYLLLLAQLAATADDMKMEESIE